MYNKLPSILTSGALPSVKVEMCVLLFNDKGLRVNTHTIE